MQLFSHAALKTTWVESTSIRDPHRRLLFAVIEKALRDALYGTPRLAADAWAYLQSRNFEADCRWFDFEPHWIRKLVQEECIAMQKKFTEEQIQEMHRRYVNERISLEQLARENNTSAATISRQFSLAGLATRRGGPPGTAKKHSLAKPGQRSGQASAADYMSADLLALREINTLLGNIGDKADARGRIEIKLNVDMEIVIAGG